jgi:carbamoyl-phosphate synthase large subunit
MQGSGNDYIFFNCMEREITNPEGLSVRLADRRYGIGGDGVVLILPSKVADAKMRTFNLDGSEGRIGGNGIRCVGKYLYDHHIVDKMVMTIETLSGIRTLYLHKRNGEVANVSVDMGKPVFTPSQIPVKLDGDRIIDRHAVIADRDYRITCLSVGNPHCVVFQPNVDTLDIQRIGPLFEESELFPERVNAEFIKVLDSRTIRMRVWERGSGETWACGTGACAAVVAAVENGYCKKGDEITVKLIGGDLKVKYDDNGVILTGDAISVFEGTVQL